MSSDQFDRAPRPREESEDTGKSVDERFNVTRTTTQSSTEESQTASPIADEVADLDEQLANAEPGDSLNQDTSPPEAKAPDGTPLTNIHQADAEEHQLGEIIDWRYTGPEEEWVILQTEDEQVQRQAATPEQTVQDWVALIRAGGASLRDVEPRPYQDWTAEEMQQRVDAELRGGSR